MIITGAKVIKTFALADKSYDPSYMSGLVRAEYDVFDNGAVRITAYARKVGGAEYVSQVSVVPIEEARESWVRLTKRKNWNFVRVK